jgi:hypothetical protein
MKLVSITTLVVSSLVGIGVHSYDHDGPSTRLRGGSTLDYTYNQGSRTNSVLIESNGKAKVGTGEFLEWRDDGGCEEGSFDDCCTEYTYCNWMYDYKYACQGRGFYCSMSSPDQGGPTPYFPPQDEEA